MSFWARLTRRDVSDGADVQAAVEARKKLAQAQRDTAWIAEVAAPQLARLSADQFVDRIRAAMALARKR